MEYYVYILTNSTNSVLYCGITQNVEIRTEEHILKIDKKGFAERYNCNKLVYVESTNDVTVAIKRETQIKGMTRFRKIKLIESLNPEWKDLLFC